MNRRDVIKAAAGIFGTGALAGAQEPPFPGQGARPAAIDRVQGRIKITKLETFLVKPRWLFLKIHTDAGIVGLGEPVLEGRALTVKAAVEEVARAPIRAMPAFIRKLGSTVPSTPRARP